MRTLKSPVFGELVIHNNIIIYDKTIFHLDSNEDYSILEDKLYSKSDFDRAFNPNLEQEIELFLKSIFTPNAENSSLDQIKNLFSLTENQRIALAVAEKEASVLRLIDKDIDKVRVYLFFNPHASFLFDDLLSEIHRSYLERIQFFDSFKPLQLDYLINLNNKELNLRISKCNYLNLTPNSLNKLLNNEVEEIRCNALGFKDIEQNYLIELALNKNLSNQERLAALKYTTQPSEELTNSLLEEYNIEILRGLAKNIYIDSATILNLMSVYDEEGIVRYNLFNFQYLNENVPIELIRESFKFTLSISIPFIKHCFLKLESSDIDYLTSLKKYELTYLIIEQLDKYLVNRNILSLKSKKSIFTFKILDKLRIASRIYC